MKLNTWQWIGLAVLIVCLGLYLFRQLTTPQSTPTPPAATQPAATLPAK